MRAQAILDDASGSIYPENFDIEAHKTSTKLLPVLEVVGGSGSTLSALSCHGSYLATVTQEVNETVGLFIIALLENRFYLLKRLREMCTVLIFHPYSESTLFVATLSRKVYSINVDDGNVMVMEGHSEVVERVGCGMRSTVVVTHNTKEAFVWSWPSLTLTTRLRLLENVPLVWAGHIWQREELVAGFSSGTVMVWTGHTRHLHPPISPPQGLTFVFEAFTLSRCGEWLVGGGKSHLVVTYSLPARCVTQVVQLPASCPTFYWPVFLPSVYPKFSQVLAVQGSTGVLSIIDFSTCHKLKTLRSQRFDIKSFSTSEDGSFTAITYSSGVTKLYPTRCLFPEDPKVISVTKMKKEEVAFKIIEKREKEKEEEIEKRVKRKELIEGLEELLDKNKWYRILRQFGSYPDKYRKLIWVSTLKLPRNYSTFGALLDKGIHPAFENLAEEFSLTDNTLFRALQRTLSCLSHWAPFLTGVVYLPELLFPFIKLFHSNLLLCFEVSATFLLNWCRLWFDFWPHPCVTMVNVVESLVCEEEPALVAHFIRHRVTAEHYAWTPLTSAFSRVFSEGDWLTLWDHILSNPPSFLPCVAAAFTIRARHTLLSCSEAAEIKIYYQQETWLPVNQIINTAYDLHKDGSGDVRENMPPLKQIFGGFTPLPADDMPLFTIGPRDAVREEIEEMESKLNDSAARLGSRLSKERNVRHRREEQQQRQQEDMVYIVGRDELHRQEEECLDSIINLRKRHLATTMRSTGNHI